MLRAQALSHVRDLNGGGQEGGKSCLKTGCLLESRVEGRPTGDRECALGRQLLLGCLSKILRKWNQGP